MPRYLGGSGTEILFWKMDHWNRVVWWRWYCKQNVFIFYGSIISRMDHENNNTWVVIVLQLPLLEKSMSPPCFPWWASRFHQPLAEHTPDQCCQIWPDLPPNLATLAAARTHQGCQIWRNRAQYGNTAPDVDNLFARSNTDMYWIKYEEFSPHGRVFGNWCYLRVIWQWP